MKIKKITQYYFILNYYPVSHLVTVQHLIKGGSPIDYKPLTTQVQNKGCDCVHDQTNYS